MTTVIALGVRSLVAKVHEQFVLKLEPSIMSMIYISI